MTLEKGELLVLYLEDSLRDIEIVHQILLENFKCPVFLDSAGTEEEYIRCIKNKKYDVILADYTLPSFNAEEALKLAISICPYIPFICVSGTIGEEIAVELIKEGAADYVLKDRLGRLAFAISRAVKNREIEIAVAESKKEAAFLRKNESDYLEILDGSSEGTFIYNFKNQKIDYSEKWLARFDIKNIPVESVPSYIAGLIHPDDKERIWNEKKAIYENKHDRFMQEYRYLIGNQHIWVQEKGKILYDKNGELDKIYGTISDITDRKEAEKALRKSEEKYRLLFNSIDEGFCIIEMLFNEQGSAVDFQIIDYNAAYEKQTGLHGEKGKRVKEFLPMLEDHWFKIYGQVALTGEQVRFTNEATALNRYYDVYAFKIGERDSRKVGVLFNDITKRKSLDEALKISEGNFRAIFERSQIGIIVGDMEGRIVHNNPVIEGILGYGKEELIGITFSKFTHPEDLSVETPLVLDLIEGKRDYYEIEKRYIRKNGQVIWVKLIGTFMWGGKGEKLGLTMIEDITDRKRSEQALNESEKKANLLVADLEEADKNKNQFISVLSHELRNPLAAISAGIQVLDLTKDINQAAKVKEIINRQTNQLCKLVDDLLELTRITQNKIKLKKENINLNEIVKSATEDIRLEYENKGLKLGTKIQTKPIILSADPVRITQSIGNILFNALKFTKANGTVWLTLKTEKNNAVISVIDNGIGISPETLSGLFTPFTQADNTLDRSGGGLGLGLSIVKGIVDLHGGDVSALSDGLGKGSTFTIRLPITTRDNYMMEKPTSDNNDKKSLNMLIIEDNRDFADLLSPMLSTIGYTVNIAYDGIDGVKQAKQIKPDVIFCDIGLPGMDGFEVAESIRNDNELKDVHLIAMTGYAGEDDAERVLKAGFNKHLAKPVDFAKLKNVLKGLKDRNNEVFNV